MYMNSHDYGILHTAKTERRDVDGLSMGRCADDRSDGTSNEGTPPETSMPQRYVRVALVLRRCGPPPDVAFSAHPSTGKGPLAESARLTVQECARRGGVGVAPSPLLLLRCSAAQFLCAGVWSVGGQPPCWVAP